MTNIQLILFLNKNIINVSKQITFLQNFYSVDNGWFYYKNQRIWISALQTTKEFFNVFINWIKLNASYIVLNLTSERIPYIGQYSVSNQYYQAFNTIFLPFNWYSRDIIYNSDTISLIRGINNQYYHVFSVGQTVVSKIVKTTNTQIFSGGSACVIKGEKTKVTPDNIPYSQNKLEIISPTHISGLLVTFLEGRNISLTFSAANFDNDFTISYEPYNSFEYYVDNEANLIFSNNMVQSTLNVLNTDNNIQLLQAVKKPIAGNSISLFNDYADGGTGSFNNSQLKGVFANINKINTTIKNQICLFSQTYKEKLNYKPIDWVAGFCSNKDIKVDTTNTNGEVVSWQYGILLSSYFINEQFTYKISANQLGTDTYFTPEEGQNMVEWIKCTRVHPGYRGFKQGYYDDEANFISSLKHVTFAITNPTEQMMVFLNKTSTYTILVQLFRNDDTLIKNFWKENYLPYVDLREYKAYIPFFELRMTLVNGGKDVLIDDLQKNFYEPIVVLREFYERETTLIDYQYYQMGTDLIYYGGLPFTFTISEFPILDVWVYIYDDRNVLIKTINTPNEEMTINNVYAMSVQIICRGETKIMKDDLIPFLIPEAIRVASNVNFDFKVMTWGNFWPTMKTIQKQTGVTLSTYYQDYSGEENKTMSIFRYNTYDKLTKKTKIHEIKWTDTKSNGTSYKEKCLKRIKDELNPNLVNALIKIEDDTELSNGIYIIDNFFDMELYLRFEFIAYNMFSISPLYKYTYDNSLKLYKSEKIILPAWLPLWTKMFGISYEPDVRTILTDIGGYKRGVPRAIYSSNQYFWSQIVIDFSRVPYFYIWVNKIPTKEILLGVDV